jgi:hypothetical protein
LMTSLSRGFVADNIINGLLMIDFAKNHDNWKPILNRAH